MSDLSQRTILVTRPGSKAEQMAKIVRRHNGIPIIFPTIEIDPPQSWQPVDETIQIITSFDWIVFSSANGVKFFLERLDSRRSRSSINDISIAAVGSKTADSLRTRQVPVDLVPRDFTVEGLSKALSTRVRSGQHLLWIRGSKARKMLKVTLESMGVAVREIVVYRNVPAEPSNTDRVTAALVRGEMDYLTFTSPSTFQNFVDILGDAGLEDPIATLQSQTIAAIGPVTSQSIEEYGVPVALVPDTSTIEDLITVIARHVQTSKVNHKHQTE